MSARDPVGTRELRDAALALADRGWHVFPCVPGRKHPALKLSWPDIATTDPDRIRFWWRRTPYNIAIACGPSNLVVLDLDTAAHGAGPANADAISGAEQLAELCLEHDEPYPAQTMAVKTPSGGWHLYYQAPGDPVLNSAGKLAPLVDVRGAGGYVIGPRSRIPRQGRYWLVRDLEPVPLPAWIDDLARRSSAPVPAVPPRPIGSRTAYADAVLGYETENVARAVEGTRNDTLFRAARSLGQLIASHVLNVGDVRAALTQASTAAGLSRAEIARTIESGLKSGARMPRGLPELSFRVSERRRAS